MSIQNISKILLNNNSYYFVEEVKQICPAFFYGCAKTSRMIIDKKKINNTDYIYATYAPKILKWNLSEESVKSAKVLLTCNWVEQNVPNWKTENGTITNNEKLDLEIIPPVLELKYEEKFRDENGNIIEIETRGIKTLDGIYFYGKDVEKMLELDDISTLLNHETSSYIFNTHYKKFYRNEPVNHGSNTKEKNYNRIYLTYFGLVKLLITTRSKVAEKFQKWAMSTLFTIQMGNEIEKEKLGTKILNINIETYRNVFKKHSTTLPCVYLVELGKVKDLKNTFDITQEIYDKNIDNNIYKFGFTDDIDRRLYEHQSDYGKLENVNLQLIKFTLIEQKYKVEAEKDLRKFFSDFNKRLIIKNNEELNIKRRNELIILNKDELDSIFRYYKLLTIEYSGSSTELQNKLEKKQNEIEKLKVEHENELLRKNLIIQDLEHVNKYKDLELKMKEMELVCLRNNIKI
jgi:predicted GIY-YIG superfamily endonuclease